MKDKECELDWGKDWERGSGSEKKAEKDTLISELQILSPVRFNIPLLSDCASVQTPTSCPA